MPVGEQLCKSREERAVYRAHFALTLWQDLSASAESHLDALTNGVRRAIEAARLAGVPDEMLRRIAERAHSDALLRLSRMKGKHIREIAVLLRRGPGTNSFRMVSVSSYLESPDTTAVRLSPIHLTQYGVWVHCYREATISEHEAAVALAEIAADARLATRLRLAPAV